MSLLDVPPASLVRRVGAVVEQRGVLADEVVHRVRRALDRHGVFSDRVEAEKDVLAVEQ
jgi:hypothetical protein